MAINPELFYIIPNKPFQIIDNSINIDEILLYLFIEVIILGISIYLLKKLYSKSVVFKKIIQVFCLFFIIIILF